MPMRNKAGILCMVLGAALVAAALLLVFWNYREAETAAASSEAVLPQIKEAIPKETGEIGDNGVPDHAAMPDPYDSEMTVVEIDGYGYVGYLTIPALGLELPVMAEWDYARLRLAPCRYSGSTKTGDLVIAAHNYARHFGSLQTLLAGDEVRFTDMDGVVTVYEVAAVEILQPTAVEEMTAGEYDLTLFTCTYGGQSRVTVRCDRRE